jgi:hypothetical protein
VTETPHNNYTYYNLSQEILTVYTEQINFVIAVTDLDQLNNNFLRIQGSNDDLTFKNSYLSQYENIFKTNQSSIRISVNFPNSLNNDKLIVSKINFQFVKEILFDTNYFHNCKYSLNQRHSIN